MRTIPELLSPAGEMAALRAAVDAGADAVYLGYRAFGARASAQNFDGEALGEAVRYAHLHHVRVYVTVNTLIKPDETEAVALALDEIAQSGADALIIQDLGVAALALRHCPGMRLHASTQMALCNAQGVRWAGSMGFSRVVLARECGLADIRSAVSTGVEIEVFAHGALCTAVSGRCLMSSMAGGRSGNRGRCAQPCRQAFSLEGSRGALLSQRDLCLIDDLPALADAGVRSLKLEGRLKSPEYVSVVTGVYRRALDEVARGAFEPGNLERREALLQIFNRGQFTRGHAMGEQDAALVCQERVAHDGLPLGSVSSVRGGMAVVRLERALHNGDSLQLRGAAETDLRYSGPDAPAGSEALVRLRPGVRVQPGQPVFRLADARQLESARAHHPRAIPIDLRASFAVGQPAMLTLSDGQSTVSATGPAGQPADKHALSRDEALRQLSRLGDTPFSLAHAEVFVGEGVFVSVGTLNALRREASRRLAEARISAFCEPCAPATLPSVSGQRPSPISSDTLAVIFRDPHQAPALQARSATLLIYAPRDLRAEPLRAALEALPPGTWLCLPPQLTQRTQEAVLEEASRARIAGLMAQSVGQLSLDFPLLAGPGIPVCNREGMDMLLRTNALGFTLWPEWTGGEQRGLLPLSLPCLMSVYGREALMLLNHCPARVRRGWTAGRESCGLCNRPEMACGVSGAALTDRKGYRFPLIRTRFPEGCELTVLNALPTDLRAFDAARRSLGAGMLISFTDEPAQVMQTVVSDFSALLQTGACPPSQAPATSGHWQRGVE